MSIINKSLTALSITLIFNACGGNSKASEEGVVPLANTIAINDKQYFRVMAPKTCTQKNKNRFVYQVMHDSYLWDTTVPELDYEDAQYDTSEKLLKKLKSDNDHFSFLISKEEAQSYFEEGKNDNFGFGLARAKLSESTYALVILFVYPESPAGKAGIKRGDLISMINDIPITLTDENTNKLNTLLSNEKSLTFTFLKEDGTHYSKTISKKSYDIKTILHADNFVSQDQTKRIGYMVYQDFLDNSKNDIDAQFKEFKAHNTNELILDLRYNGGGSGAIARHLASLIGGTNVAENVFHHVNFNERYSQFNETSYFEASNENALNLKRVFVITTEHSCSSSELVINALRASANNLEVIQIGDTTCGKPYGYAGAGIFCDKALYAINIETKNGDNIGDYTEGLKPTCIARDNPFKDFGNKQENSLAEALHYIENGKCNLTSSQHKATTKKVSFLPAEGFKRIMSAY